MAYKILEPEITNISKEAWKRAKVSKVFLTLSICSAFLVIASFIVVNDSIQNTGEISLYLSGIWPLLFPFVYIMWMKNKVANEFWKEVSQINGWRYRESIDIRDEMGIMFHQGNQRTISNYIEGEVDGRKFRMFNYRFTIGSGKNSVTYAYIVFGFKFSGAFPHIYLNNKKNSYNIRIGERIPIPSEFEKKFSLSAPKEYETEALEIFTPDIIEKLLNNDLKHDVELVNQEVLLFVDGTIDSFKKLESEFNIALALEDLLDEKLDTFKFQKIGNLSYDLK